VTTQTDSRTESGSLPEGLADFLLPLHREFEPRRQALLAERRKGLEASIAGAPPSYLPPSEATTTDWRITVPDWAQDQRNQITGPADNAKLLIAMTNSGAPGCMPDGEDSITTDWENVRAAHANMIAAIQGTLSFTDPASGKTTQVNDSEQVWFFRPRGMHMSESRAIPGETLSASLFDLGEVFFGTIEQRKAVASDPALQRRLCFYIPKVESAADAAWWSDLLAAMEEAAGIPVGQTKVMFLIESLPAGYQVEDILFAARRHVIGLNLGRWDYMASLIHYKLGDPDWILPDRNTIPHDVPFFQNVRLRIVDVCHRHGALAIGGMTAIFPDRRNEELNTIAMERLRVDKRNEAVLGFDGAWTGHPDQTRIAVEQFPAPNQTGVTHPDAPRQPDLTPNPRSIGRITLAGTRDAVRTVIEYRYGHLTGVGARLIKGFDASGKVIGNFMEDLATDRIYRLMIAQRIRHGVVGEDGTKHTQEVVATLFDEELAKLLDEHKGDEDAATVAEKYRKARELSEQMILSGDFDPR
jgi:malate synthase